MELGTLLLLSILVSIDSLYGGIIYKQEWGRVPTISLVITLFGNLILITLFTLLGKLILIYIGAEIAKLISIILLGIISILFNRLVKEVEDPFLHSSRLKLNLITDSLCLEEVEEDRVAALGSLLLITSIDVALISFIAAVLTSSTLLNIIIFSYIDVALFKLGNLISIYN
ncbi:MAG: hypothetical protein ACQEQI_03575 [Bacillota bacterium]